ncbi:hypothetical protein [Natrinema sp. 1APR25-10V2]|uniref:hypothetical protein n=1 Tax=Natrinema sp. 1APR25-10V2 TaxID=2951081 RepID=UPI0028768269|nr:hypothetical protein [Natrinema sp. 1APR25-10V2]MDS0475762.1 hypothetical protein [Natrinema sp. 1APR25-10V2]
MVTLQGVAVALLGGIVALGCAGAVYRDATDVGISRPRLWAGFVFLAVGGGLALFLSPLDVPIPGLLVIVLAGPALYLFERDDAQHGDEPADPHALPNAPDSGESGRDRRGDE